MRIAATTPVPAGAPSTSEACSPELAASALQRMKGCRVAIEGIDDRTIDFLTGLSATTVEGLVRTWEAGWGFPTASLLSAVKDRLDGRHAAPTPCKARDAA
jgi:hypothetical protein